MKRTFSISIVLAISCTVALAQGSFISGPTPVNPGSTQTYSCPNCLMLFQDIGGTQYWSITNGTITSSIYNHNTVTVQWSSSAGTGNIAWRNSSMVLTSKNVTIGVPVATITGPPETCMNAPGYQYSTQTGKTNYSWTVNGGTVTAGQGTSQATVTWALTGSRSISVSYTTSGVTANGSYNVLVNGLPTPTVSGPTSACVNTGGHSYSTQSGMTNYTWTINGGTINSGQGTNQVSVTWTSTGSRSVSVNYNDLNGCAGATPGTRSVTVNARPAPTISGPSTVCVNTSGHSYSTQTGRSAYSWTVSGGTINSGQGTSQISVSWTSTGSRSVSVNYTNGNGCASSSPGTKTVTVNAQPSAPSIMGPSTACVNTSKQYTVPDGASGYTWTANGGTITSGQGTDQITVSWTSAGSRSVGISYSENTCVVNATKPVTVSALPTPTIAGPSSACVNTGGHSYSTQSGMTNYTWTINGGTINSGQGTSQISVTWTSTGSRSVSVNYTNANGCTGASPGTRSVTVHARPTPTISGSSSACVNTSGHAYTTQTGMTSYSWAVSGGTINSGQGTSQVSVTWTSTGSRSVSVNYTNANGCTGASPGTRSVTVYARPTPTVSGPSSVCVNTSGHSYPTQTGMSDYSWAVSGGTINSGQGTSQVSVTWTSAGSRSLNVHYTNTNGCQSSTPGARSVTVNTQPSPPSIAGPSTACVNTSAQYAVPDGMSGYTWTVSGGTITSGQGTDQVGVTWTSAGSRSVGISYTENTCVVSGTKPVTVTSPTTPSISGPPEACINTGGHQYSAQSGHSNYAWTVNGGTITAGQGTHQATITWTSSGSRSVSVSFTSNGCSTPASDTYPVQVNTLPAPTISGPSSACVSTGGHQYNTQSGMTGYSWTVNGGTIHSGQGTSQISVTWTSTGSRSVSVNYTNANGCTGASPGTRSVTVYARPTPTISGNANVCVNSTGNTYTTQTGMSDYSWTASGGTINSGQGTNQISVTWTSAGSRSVNVHYTNTNGCQSSTPGTRSVTVNAQPSPPSIAGLSTACVNTSAQYTVPDGMTGYAWTVSGGTITSGQGTDQVTVTWTSAGSRSVGISYTENTCVVSGTKSVTVTSPTTPSISGPPEACINTGGHQYSAQSGHSNYAWTVNGGTITAGQGTHQATITWTSSGSRSVSVSFTSNGCSTPATDTYPVQVNALPAPTISGPSGACVSTGGHQYNTQSGMTGYSWTVNGGTINLGQSTDEVTVTWTSTGSRSISVNYDDINGCRAATSGTRPVTVNARPAPTISGNANVCVNSTGNTYTTQTGMSDYSWTASGGTINSGQGTDEITVTWDNEGAGSVNVHYTDANGCESTSPGTRAVTVSGLPSPAVMGASGVCANISIPYTTYAEMSNYTWSVSGGEITSGQGTDQVTVLWSNAGTGSVDVNYTDENGCRAATPGTRPVTISARPAPAISGLADACADTPGYQYTTQSDMTNYSWAINGGTITAGQGTHEVTVTWTGTGAGEVSVDYTDANGCSSTAPGIHAVNINVLPVPPVGGPATACENTGGHVYFTQAGKANYSWTVSGGTVTEGQDSDQATVSWHDSGPGSVSVNYTESNGCTALTPTDYPITIHPRAVPTIQGPATACVNTDGNVYGTESGMTNYSWTVSSGAITAGQGTPAVTVVWTATGPGSVTVSYNDANNCEATPATYPVLVHPRPVPAISGPSNTDAGTGGHLYTTDAGMTGYVWDVTGGTIETGQGTNQVAVTWNNPGTMSVTVNYSDANNCEAETPASYPVAVNTTVFIQPHNYIMTIDMMKEGLPAPVDVGDVASDDYVINMAYFDGLGRPMQNVAIGQSPLGHDVVVPVEYDAFGREAKKYLPYARGVRDGRYVPGAVAEQASFYDPNAPAVHVAGDANPWSVTVFESSPLNRVLEQGAPGTAWQPDGINNYTSADHTIKNAYEFNGEDEVLLWTVSYPPSYPLGIVNAGTAESPAYYGANELFKNKTRDEGHHEVIAYVDKLGRTILKRVQAVDGTSAVNDTTYASTYYIYDNFGSLVCVIPPEATKRLGDEYLSASTVARDNFLRRWAFRYQYDHRRRMTIKQVPGAEPVYMVYDNRDRLVLTQDGNQRANNQWLFTKYDMLNRPMMTGIYTHSDTISRDNMNALISTTAFSEDYDGNTTFHGYTNNVFPTDSLEVLTVTYYDNYDFVDDLAGTAYEFVSSHLEGQETTANTRVKGQVTGTKTNVLGTNDFLWGVNYYDDKYRPIQTVATNSRGNGVDRMTSVYDFVGKVLSTKTTTEGHDIARRLAYDHAGRLLETWHGLDSEDSVLLAKNEYNEVGQLVTKKLHSEDLGSTFKQNEDYRYNIRGWLTRINNADLNTNDGGPKDFFGMEFGYNNDLGIGDFTPQYNGNISATKWSANLGLALPYLNEHTQRAYKFIYDPLNRLREANYAAKTGSWSESLGYREAMAYDLNGNILSLYRNSETGTPIDWLTYDYGDVTNRSNQLKSITDQGVITKGFKDGNTTGGDFVYDGNGNLIQDKNKGLGNIKYNSYLNLKEQIDKSTGEKIRYIYNADGVKLAEEIYAPGAQTPSKRTDYVGPFVYENDTLKFIQHEEGKIIIPKPESTDPSPEYQYQVKDHLDNVRLTFTTKQKTDEFKATMEDTGVADYSNPRVQEMAYFGNLFETEIRNVNQWLNHTSNAIGNAVYLDGSETKTIGPYTMLKVYPGDTVRMGAFGKYKNESSYNTMPLATFLVALMNPVQTAAISVDGGAGLTTSSLMDGLIPLLTSKGSSSTTPAVYLNYILFDKDFKVADLGFDRIDESCGFDPLQEATVSFDKMELERIIDRVGYLYVYVSNESEGTRVWLDDLTITYSQSPIVQFEDYYPFGLSQSETAFERGNDKYKGTVTTDGIGLKDLAFRQYDAATGRFDAVDLLAELQLDQSTYQYAGNNPVSQVDVLGLDQDDHDKDKRKKRKEERMVNGKKVKVHNGFENKQQRRSERAANQRERQQARADRREQRQQRREEHAKNKEEGKDGVQASNNSSDRESESGDSDGPTIVYIDVNGPPYPGEDKDERGLPKNIVNSVNNGSPDRVFSYSDDVVASETNNTSSTLPISVVRSYEIARKNPDVERTRQYLYRNHPINEARALYQRMLITRNGNYQSILLKQNIAVLANTTTSDDVIDPAREEIKCPTCPSGWEDLIEFKPPKSIYDKFAAENKRLTPSIPNVPGQGSPWVPTWYVHEIENARGSKINLDKYSVTITELPTVNDDQMTIDELFNHIRVYLDHFNSDEIADFFDYPDEEFAESENWETNDYVGVIKVFRAHLNAVMFDDLAVVASEQTENTWIFSTIHSPATENHAVSGNRQFGFTDNGDGTYTIFTRGADVATGVIDVLAGEAIFAGGEELWNNFLDNIIEFVNQNSGSAGDKQITSNRYDLEQ